MKAPHLDYVIEDLKCLKRTGDLSDYGKEKLKEFELLKKALTEVNKNNVLHSVIESLDKLPIYQVEPKRDYSDCWLDIWELGKDDEDAKWIKIEDVKKLIKELENSL